MLTTLKKSMRDILDGVPPTQVTVIPLQRSAFDYEESRQKIRALENEKVAVQCDGGKVERQIRQKIAAIETKIAEIEDEKALIEEAKAGVEEELARLDLEIAALKREAFDAFERDFNAKVLG